MENRLLEVIELTNQAMLFELFTYPSFGKVSPYSKGSHQDMDHFTFIDSISVLNKYMLQFALLGYRDHKIELMYEKAVQIGIDCEKDMFKKTNGVNTHKGLIFVLGTLVCSYAKVLYDQAPFEDLFHNCSLLVQSKYNELTQLNQKLTLTNGEKIFLKYQIEGVRKEAYLGFPIIQKALHYLDLNNKSTLVNTFIFIMSECDDTTIINRVGIDGLLFVKDKMKSILNKKIDLEEVIGIENEFIKRGISPGGAADLLCGTIFVSLIKNKFRSERK